MSRALVIDPDPRWRQAVATALERAGVTVVATSNDLRLAPQLARETAADLLLLGVAGETDSRELQRCLRRLHGRCTRLITFAYVGPGDTANVAAALGGGAFRANDRRLVAAETVDGVVQEFEAERRRRTRRVRLTPREIEVLRLVATGLSNQDAARTLWVTDQTIKFHVANICKRLDVRDRSEAIRRAVDHGIVGPDDPDRPGPGIRAPRRPIGPTRGGGAALDLPGRTGPETERASAPRQAA